MKNESHTSSSPTLCASKTSLLATPIHSIWKYGFFNKPAQQGEVAKYSNLKWPESLSFSGDIESLEPTKFNPTNC